ncbi:Subtilase family protein [Rhizobiales bacterium GAS113]|nr:Subtilase family protein [Rhizobiales bacterium GAS113]
MDETYLQRELILLTPSEAFSQNLSDFAPTAPSAEIGASLSLRPEDEVAIALSEFGASMRPLFPASAPRHGPVEAPPGAAASAAPAPGGDQPSLVYSRVVASDDQLDVIAERLRKVATVKAAYVKPAAQPPINKMLPTAGPPSAAAGTPDFQPRQAYLNAAPGGVDAAFAWTQPGGRGDGINIVDVEGEWRVSHEDLQSHNRGVLSGTPPGSIDWRNHGTAVIGVINAADNGIGVTGVAPNSTVGMVSIFPNGSAAAIRDAANHLQAGDVLLVELHRPGPRFNFNSRPDQKEFVAVEWWPDDFDAIQYAVGRGIIVVEAAGNGSEDLDDVLYDSPAAGFPATWSNPYRRGPHDSGAILVGAGAPPPGTNGGAGFGPDRSKLDFSNFGSAVDAQGWGRQVTSCAYGDLQAGPAEDAWYTDQFSGTSSASPIIVGVIACLQGFAIGNGLSRQTAASIRNLLRTTGSPQTSAPGSPVSQRIGNRPDLKALTAAVTAMAAALTV